MFGEIDEQTILKYSSQVPRYTSYPTAPNFSAGIDSNTYISWLKDLGQEETLSLYIHIPFCQQLCWYCGCYTTITQRYEPIENYANILEQEIRLVGEILRQKKHRVSHIHFGGGSPTILTPDSFKFLMATIRAEFEIAQDAEIAIEVDPRNVDEDKIKTYFECGINRVSLGVQDFNQEVQAAINREQSFDLVRDCVKNFRKHGIKNINLDLIYGLPKQTVEMVKNNIDYSLLLDPDRIALFAYAHVGWKKKHMRLIEESDLPDDSTRIKMYKSAAEKLQRSGYLSIGLDHFAKPSDTMVQAFRDEKLKRNFQGYSTDTSDNIIGFGVSSIGYLSGFGYVQNTLDFKEYEKGILTRKLAISKGIKISKEDQIRKKIIDEIMCYLEVDLKEISAFFDLPENYFGAEIAKLEDLKKDGLVRVKNNVIKINVATPQISRVVCSIFDKFFESSAQKYSKI